MTNEKHRYVNKTIRTQNNLAVIKSWGPGISSRYYECGPWVPATFIGKCKKTEPKEIPGCLISRPLVVFTRQLKILVTTLKEVSPKFDNTIIISLKYGYLLQKCVLLIIDIILQGPLKDY